MNRFAASPSAITLMSDPYGAEFDKVAGNNAMNRAKLDKAVMMGDYLQKSADIHGNLIEEKGDMQAQLQNAAHQSEQMQGWGSLLGNAANSFAGPIGKMFGPSTPAAPTAGSGLFAPGFH